MKDMFEQVNDDSLEEEKEEKEKSKGKSPERSVSRNRSKEKKINLSDFNYKEAASKTKI